MTDVTVAHLIGVNPGENISWALYTTSCVVYCLHWVIASSTIICPTLLVPASKITADLCTLSTSGYRKFALDCQRRFLHAYGTLVLRFSELRYRKVLQSAMDMGYTDTDGGLSLEGLVHVTGEYRRITKPPEDPYLQLKV